MNNTPSTEEGRSMDKLIVKNSWSTPQAKSSYRVVYTWRGERHQMLGNYTRKAAADVVKELRAAHWQAWAEQN